MKKKTSTILAAAVSGLLIGASTGCTSEDATGKDPANDEQPAKGGAGKLDPTTIAEKHACKGHNTCAAKGGCATGDNECAGKNSCKEKGGCATVAHHTCKGQNTCKELGGCGSGDNGCKAKNSCEGKGGCAVPIKH